MAARKKTVRKKVSKTESAVARRREAALNLPALPDDLVAEFGSIVNEESAIAQAATGGWPFISTANGTFSHPSAGDIGPEVELIVLAAVRANYYYAGRYDPSQQNPVTCYAVTADFANLSKMAPPPELPSRIADQCLGCEKNEFGSDDRGRGKACRNYFVLACLSGGVGDMDADRLDKAEGSRLRIPPTSLAQFAQFSARMNKMFPNRPLFAFRTRFVIEKDAKVQFRVLPEVIEPITDDDILRTLVVRRAEGREQLLTPPPTAFEDTKKSSGGGLSRPRSRKPRSKK